MKTFRIIGIMSGTSMDGIDFADVTFSLSDHSLWSYQVNYTQTVPYPENMQVQLSQATEMSDMELTAFDKILGTYFGEKAREFMTAYAIPVAEIDAVASHGHTIFHQPENGFTLQIGSGAAISSATRLTVINDFRTIDVAHGGQGAPLVPIGDLHLFKANAEAFLNIGGFSNITILQHDIKAYDISPGNLPLNILCQRYFNRSYDKDGVLSKSGTIVPELLEKLNALSYYQRTGPKSLGTEWLDEHFYPLLSSDVAGENLLRTVTEHIAFQIAQNMNETGIFSVMITGGGAKNSFLIERIRAHFTGKIIIPSPEVIDFKEAIIFAFLGALHLANLPGNIPSVTGASRSLVLGVKHPHSY